MITEVYIKDPKDTTVSYLPEVFKEPRCFKFRPGINIVIGPNGCGKTTLLKLIQDLTLTYSSPYSRAPEVEKDPFLIFEYGRFFRGETDELKTGCQIKATWAGMTFRFLPPSDLKAGQEFGNMSLFASSLDSSTGQKTMVGLDHLFTQMFSRTDYNFPFEDIKRHSGKDPRLKELIKFYLSMNLDIREEEFEYTVLMDEPDRNLDLENTKQLLGILGTRKEMTQIIAVIHNPVLIYRLSKVPGINFIELQEGYKNRIIKFVEDGK